MLSASSNHDEYVFALTWLRGSMHYIRYSAPDIIHKILTMESAIPIEALSEAMNKGLANPRDKAPSIQKLAFLLLPGTSYILGCKLLTQRTVAGAVECAKIASLAVDENPLAAIVAFYYVQRAKSLGLVDPSKIVNTITSKLTDGCVRHQKRKECPIQQN